MPLFSNWFRPRTRAPQRGALKTFTGVVVTLLALGLSLVANLSTAYASGNPPSNVHPAPSGGVNTLHGANPALARGVQRVVHARDAGSSIVTYSAVNGTAPVIMVHGIDGDSAASCTAGMFGWPRSYLRSSSGHPGLGSDQIYWTGPIYLVGFYNGDYNCDGYLSTHNNPHGNYSGASSCNGVGKQGGGSVSNSDSSVGTNSEPLEHVACELSWYIYWNWAKYGTNVKILAFSMGGLIVRYMIERVQAGDTHFAYFLDISDVVTLSTPHGGITDGQLTIEGVNCNCYQASEMQYDLNWGHYSAFMTDIYNHDHPNAAGGTDWTLIGSLSLYDPLDWDFQATYMSNSGGLSNNHRIGYDYPIKCNGTTTYPNGYGHSADYTDDQCDAYDAPYYYCDGCSRSKSSWFDYTTGAPHSLHEVLFAFVYNNW